MDSSLAPAKKGLCVGKTKEGQGTKWMVVADGQGLPVGGTLEASTENTPRIHVAWKDHCHPTLTFTSTALATRLAGVKP